MDIVMWLLSGFVGTLLYLVVMHRDVQVTCGSREEFSFEQNPSYVVILIIGTIFGVLSFVVCTICSIIIALHTMGMSKY